MIIDHIGIVVLSLEKGIEQWEKMFGYCQITEPVVNSRQKVGVVFLQKAGSVDVKLIEPTDETSPVHRFALRGGGVHHICFRCEDLTSVLARLKYMNARVIAGPEPGEAFENEDIAFVYAGGLNIELIDTVKRARRKV